MNLTYGSVCSGIDAATIAWKPLGWEAVWFAQFDQEHNYSRGQDFSSKVLNYYYRDIPNLGDMTRITDFLKFGDIEAPDVLVGGTPCQAFSIAGLREGLADDRGKLTLKYAELANTLDEVRMKIGKKPSIIVWENVPGCLSTSDNAFGCLVAALSGDGTELYPPTDKRGKRLKWPNAGCIVGPTRTIAWRVLDAQYFGLAQRRRRVFLIASARDDIHPAQILFEFEGVRRDIAPSQKARKKVTCETDECVIANSTSKRDIAFGGNNTNGPIDIATARNACSSSSGRLDFESETFVVSTIDASFGRLHGASGQDLNDNHDHLIAFNWNAQVDQMNFNGYTAPTLTCSQGAAVLTAPISRVRRLTITECCRLQGFPDGFTDIPYLKKVAPDGHQYKALGNSMAVPVMNWLGKRIEKSIRKPWK